MSNLRLSILARAVGAIFRATRSALVHILSCVEYRADDIDRVIAAAAARNAERQVQVDQLAQLAKAHFDGSFNGRRTALQGQQKDLDLLALDLAELLHPDTETEEDSTNPEA